jgi:hypothetical protein
MVYGSQYALLLSLHIGPVRSMQHVDVVDGWADGHYGVSSIDMEIFVI